MSTILDASPLSALPFACPSSLSISITTPTPPASLTAVALIPLDAIPVSSLSPPSPVHSDASDTHTFFTQLLSHTQLAPVGILATSDANTPTVLFHQVVDSSVSLHATTLAPTPTPPPVDPTHLPVILDSRTRLVGNTAPLDRIASKEPTPFNLPPIPKPAPDPNKLVRSIIYSELRLRAVSKTSPLFDEIYALTLKSAQYTLRHIPSPTIDHIQEVVDRLLAVLVDYPKNNK